MISSQHLQVLPAAIALFAAGCSNVEFVHVKPGESARMAQMLRAAPTAQPVPAAPTPTLATQPSSANLAATGIQPDPALPDPHNVGDKVADLYTRGSFAMQAGQTAEAILALEEAVQLDPNFSDAWSKLVVLYQRAGKEDKAMQAYRKAKKLGQPNGPTGTAPIGAAALIP